MTVEIFMPKMSDHMEVGIIIAWLVKEGDKVEKGQPIIELETDKAAVELEAPESGILKGIRIGVEPGANVPVGETIAFIVQNPNESVPSLPPLGNILHGVEEQNIDSTKDKTTSETEITYEVGGPVRASPAVRRVARELGIDLHKVKGSGPGGRILESDVKSFSIEQETVDMVSKEPIEGQIKSQSVTISPVARRMADEMGIDLAQVIPVTTPGRITKEDLRAYLDSSGSVKPAKVKDETYDWLELNRAQLMTGKRMVESIHNAPQFSLTTSVDMTRALELREAVLVRIEAETGTRLSMTGILVKIVADALRHYPRANASFVEGRIKIHRQINIGVAVGTEEGLVVPVIHNSDKKSLVEISREMKSLQEKAQKMRFGQDDLSGGTFTISNLGMFGIDQFNAIINPSESGILAVGRIIKTPIGMPDNSISLRPMMQITLSIDHRSLDGMQGAKFLAMIKERLEEPYLIL